MKRPFTRSLLLRNIQSILLNSSGSMYDENHRDEPTGPKGNNSSRSVIQGISRRRVLQGIVAAGVGLTSPMNVYSGMKKKPQIVIIGGGIAGLHAAWILKKNGFESQIYEARSRNGGRILTAYNALGKGLTTEIGGEFIDSLHTDIRNLASEFGLSLLDTQAPNEAGFTDIYGAASSPMTLLEIVDELKSVQKKAIAVRGKVHSQKQYLKKMDSMSLADYFHNLELSPKLIEILDTAYSTEYGIELSDLSSLSVVDLFPDITTTKAELHFFGNSDERYKILGGNGQIISALQKQLSDSISYGYEIEALIKHGNRTRCVFRTDTSTREVLADFVICTVPFSILRTKELRMPISPKQRNAIDALAYGKNQKMIVGYSSSVWRKQQLSGTVYSSSDYQLLWDSSRLQNKESSSITSLRIDKTGAPLNIDSWRESMVDTVESYLPGTKAHYNGSSYYMNWYTDKFNRGSYSCYSTGQFTTFGGSENLSVGSVYFAGEHCSKNWQGFMNGAAESGRITAEKILNKIR